MTVDKLMLVRVGDNGGLRYWLPSSKLLCSALIKRGVRTIKRQSIRVRTLQNKIEQAQKNRIAKKGALRAVFLRAPQYLPNQSIIHKVSHAT